MATLTTTSLGVRAKGAFGPKPDQTVNQTALEAIAGGQFLVDALQVFIGGCGDERLDENGQRLLIPPVFGGFFSAVLADALTTRIWYRPGMTAQEHALRMVDAIRPIVPDAIFCVHTDSHAVSDGALECGCAAIAKAPAVLGLLIEYADMIDERYRDQIVANAQELLDGGYFQAGTAALVDELEAQGVRKEVLAGDHDGLAAVRVTRTGKVNDRAAFYQWCDQQGLPRVPFFEYAQWSMRATADLLTPTDEAEEFFFAAGDAFNRVVPYAICNPNMPLITIE
jgi:hypothetical protein